MDPRHVVATPGASPGTSDPRLSATIARLAAADRRFRRQLDELRGLDRRLDRALAYRLDPAANQGLARAYLDRVLVRHGAAAARVRRARHDARLAIRQADGVLSGVA